MRVRIDDPADLGATIRRARTARGLRQEDVALAAGTGFRLIGELERGKATARLDTLLRVLHVLGLEVHVEGREPGE